MPVKEDNYAEAYIVTREFLANHKREHYELHGDECTCYIPPFVTFSDIYNEAEPVRHGHWTDPESDDGCLEWHSSCCGYVVKSIAYPSFNYCPRCGARLDKESEK